MKRLAIVAAFLAIGCGPPGLTNAQIAARRDSEACNMGYATACIDYAHETQPPVVIYDPAEVQQESEREISGIMGWNHPKTSFSCTTFGNVTNCF